MDVSIFVRLLPFGCIVAISFLSLLPAADMIRTGASHQIEHFFAYFITSAICVCVGKLSLRTVATIGAGLCVFSGLMELLQQFSPGRTMALSGFLASSAGAVAGGLVAFIIRVVVTRRRTARS